MDTQDQTVVPEMEASQSDHICPEGSPRSRWYVCIGAWSCFAASLVALLYWVVPLLAALHRATRLQGGPWWYVITGGGVLLTFLVASLLAIFCYRTVNWVKAEARPLTVLARKARELGAPTLMIWLLFFVPSLFIIILIAWLAFRKLQFHLSTLAVLIFAGGILLWANVFTYPSRVTPSASLLEGRGWPFAFHEFSTQSGEHLVHWKLLSWNVCCVLVVLFLAGVLLEATIVLFRDHILRRQGDGSPYD
jgi:hypothetical protein